MSTKQIYCQAIRTEFETHYANWFPNTKLELGDYGYLENGSFNKLGNLKSDLNIDFKSLSFNDVSLFQIAHETDVDIDFRAKGEVQDIANANVSIKFKRKDAVFLKCYCSRIETIDSLASLIEPLKSNKSWKLEHVLVSDLYHTNNNTILVSNIKGAEVILACDNPAINHLNGSLDVGLSIVKQSGTDFCYTSVASITPFVRVAMLKKRFFRDEFSIKYGLDSFGNTNIGDIENSIIFDLERIE